MPRQNAARSMSLTSQESYSAVIIADMIAEVQTPPEQPDTEKGSGAKKVEVNLGYDDQTHATPPAVINVDTMDAVNANSNRANGTDIAKGVILNAEFGAMNNKADNLITEKSIEMSNAPSAQASEARKEPNDFKHMSGPRKVAFIFSFLPSIMFVLCFAVILPCEKKLPCIHEMWSLNLNDTVITTRLQLSSEKLFYSYSNGKSDSNGLIGLDVESGNQVWDSLVSNVPYLKGCGKLVENRSEACLVTYPSGLIELFNVSSGIVLLQLNTDSPGNSLDLRYDPLILPDCLRDGISEYGFVVSNNEIKIVYQGNISSSVSISSCDTKPQKLTPWSKNNDQTDLVFICRKDSKDQLIRMPQNTWCNYKNEGTYENETSVLDMGDANSLDEAILLSTLEGLIVWNQDVVTFFDVKGEKNWTVPSESHYSLNRFLLHGKFSDTGSQIALFSNNDTSTMQVTLLDYETGKMTWNKTITNAEIFDVALMNGEKKDFVLVLQRKVERDLKAEAVNHLSEVPTTLISLLSNDAVVAEADAPKTTLVNEAIFMELGSNYYQLVDERRMKYDEGTSYKSSVTVVHKPNKEIAIVTLEQSANTFPNTMIRSISVSNWDISLTENRQCSWTT